MTCPLSLFLPGFIAATVPSSHYTAASLASLLSSDHSFSLYLESTSSFPPSTSPTPPLMIFTSLVPSHHSGLYPSTTALKRLSGTALHPLPVVLQVFLQSRSSTGQPVTNVNSQAHPESQTLWEGPAICVLLSPTGDSDEQ